MRVFFIVVVINIQIFLFIRLCNLCLLKNTQKKIIRAATCKPHGWTHKVLWSSVVLQSMKMTVFHVFFLVLVMWAVHSNGRAYETESIIYNNTQQPYKENMNTETVIHSSLLHYDNFYLVLLWPNSFCTTGKFSCYRLPTPKYFIVHGLWSQQTSRPRIDCTGVNNSITTFNFTQV